MGQRRAETKRALSQVIYRHMPGSLIMLDEFGTYVQVKDVQGDPDGDVNRELLFKAINRFVDRWREESDGRVKGFELHMTSNSYRPIRPRGKSEDAPAIYCDLLFPAGFQCTNSNCGVYVSSKDSVFQGKCIRCSSSLKQMRYVWFHLCGQIFTVFPEQRIHCPKHGRKYLYLNDTRRFRTSTWRCRGELNEACNVMSEKGMGMIPCKRCTLSPEETAQRKNYLQGSVWNDSWVYYTQTVSFVNLEESKDNDLLMSPEAKKLIIESVTGIAPAGGKKLTKRATAKIKCVNCGIEIPKSSKFCLNCGTPQPQTVITEDGKIPDSIDLSPDSALVTYATLRDLERTVSAKLVAEEGSPNSASISIASAVDELKKVGVGDLMLIQDFPLTTAAIGYSRLKSGPPAWLNSFPSTTATGTKVPIYTNSVTSEAWMIKLAAINVIKWLDRNNLLPEEHSDARQIKDENVATIWLVDILSKESMLVEGRLIYGYVYSLLHSYSHLTLQLLGVNSGLDSNSLGEMLLTEALSFIIYAGESDLGALSATFNQGLGLIAADINDFARVCKFDPSCQTDDGGVCVGCLYTSRGCVSFNNDLSRSYLYGGKIISENLTQKIKLGYLDTKVKDD